MHGGSGRADADDAAAQFAQTQVIRHAGDETAVHRDAEQNGVGGGEPGAREGQLFIARQTLKIGFGELPDHRLAGRTAGGENVHDLFARHTEELLRVFRDDGFIHRWDAGDVAQGDFIARRKPGAGEMLTIKRRTVKGVAEGVHPRRLLRLRDFGS